MTQDCHDRSSKIGFQDPACEAFADQQRAPITMHRAAIHEESIGYLDPGIERSVRLDAPHIAGRLADVSSGGPQDSGSVERQSGYGCRQLYEERERRRGDLIAFNSAVGVKTDEHIAGFADGQIFGRVTSRPRRGDFSWRRSPATAVVVRKRFRTVVNHYTAPGS